MLGFLEAIQQKEKEEKALAIKWTEVEDKIYQRSEQLITTQKDLTYYVDRTEFDNEKEEVTIYWRETAGRYSSDPLEKVFSYKDYFYATAMFGFHIK